MSLNLPPYIQRRGSMYYFRQAVPSDLRHRLNRKEHVLSLRTSSIKVATLKTAALVIEADKLHAEVREGALSALPPNELMAMADNWLRSIITPEPAFRPANRATNYAPQVQAATAYAPHALPYPPPAPLPSVQAAPLRTVLKRYIQDKTNSGAWSTPKTVADITVSLKDFVEIVGNIPAHTLTRDICRTYRDTLVKLPARRTVLKEYRGRSIAELAETDIPQSARLSPRTVKNHFLCVKTFLRWVEAEGYIDHASRLTSVLRAPKDTAQGIRAFSKKELHALFHSPQYRDDSFNHAYQYWMPLILLFTGARREEIAQLHLKDIRKKHGIWCLDINSKDGKHIKTRAGHRVVPIHPFLIKVGLLKRKEALERKGHTHLFPLLKEQKAIRRGNRVSQWFTNYRRRCGVGGGKSELSDVRLHSFRHNLASFCKQNHIPRTMVKEAIGHETGEEMDVTSNYEGHYPLSQLAKELVYRIDYPERIHLDHILDSQWITRP